MNFAILRSSSEAAVFEKFEMPIERLAPRLHVDFESVNFESVKHMVLNNKSLETKPRHQFKWDTKSKDIVTSYISRSVKSTIKEKRNIHGYDSTPFGFESNF